MAAGFQAWNNGNLFQIDGDYRNINFTQRGDVTCNIPYGSMWYADVSFGNVNTPMPALYTPNTCFVMQLARSGNSVTYRVFSSVQNAFAAVMVFDTAQNSSTNVGHQAFDGAGNLVFDSGRGYMKILEVFNGEVASGAPGPNFSKSYPGKTIAVMQGVRNSSVNVVLTGVGPSARYMIFYVCAVFSSWGSNIQITAAALNTLGPFTSTGITSSNQVFYNYLVLDVTNLI